jgi:Uma2 family endonuclease
MSIAEPLTSQLPTHLDLPFTDNKPVENVYQPEQSSLLSSSLLPHLNRLHPDENYFIAADCGIYWTLKDPPLAGCKSPDWYYVPNVPRVLDGEMRRSYVMWQEQVAPLLVMEFVSGNGADEHDETPESGKFWVYEHGIKATYYAIYDPFHCVLEMFELVRGRYEPMKPESNGRFRIPPMKLEFGLWEGLYHGYFFQWLRAWDLSGALLPLPEEMVQEHQQYAERQEQIALQERQRAVQLEQLAQQERQRALQQEQLAQQERQRALQQEQLAQQERQRAEQQKQLAQQERQRAEQQEQLAQQERRRAELERQRAENLAARLRELGIDPHALS